MPRFGEAHKLLSATHPDTSPPAAGADPADGQVPTWSDALKAWIAADPTGDGVSDHGLLDGLGDDDHPHYALADKSRPDPWVAAADLSPRSLADLGTKAHDLLTGLGDDDHSIYALLAGRSGGQAFVGGTGSGDKLGLTCRSGAVAGLLELKETSPHLSLTGDLDVSGHMAVGPAAAVDANRMLNVDGSLTVQTAVAAFARVFGTASSGLQITVGLFGGAVGQGTPIVAYVYGLNYSAEHGSPSPCYGLYGINILVKSGAAGTGALSVVYGLLIAAGGWAGSKPAVVDAIKVDQQGGVGVGTVYGVHIVDQLATTVRLLELGPAVPHLRLGGGGDPAANESHLSLKFGATLKLLTEGAVDSGGAGFRQVLVPN